MKTKISMFVAFIIGAFMSLYNSTFAATGSFAENVNTVVGVGSGEVNTMLTGNVGLAVGGVIGLIIITLIIGYVKGWFGGSRK